MIFSHSNHIMKTPVTESPEAEVQLPEVGNAALVCMFKNIHLHMRENTVHTTFWPETRWTLGFLPEE